MDKKYDATLKKINELSAFPTVVDAISALTRNLVAGLVDVSPTSITEGSLR